MFNFLQKFVAHLMSCGGTQVAKNGVFEENIPVFVRRN
jgi:hypothetical protein